jgi:periplasmic protein TonB
MKKILSFICVLFFFAAVQAQTPTPVNNSDQQIYKEVEVLATFPGGLAEMHKFFGTKATIGKFGQPGTEVHFKIEFIVEKDGTITDIKLVEDGSEVSKELYNEYVKVIKEMPKWEAAKIGGTVVRSLYTLPINIKFQEELKIKKQK